MKWWKLLSYQNIWSLCENAVEISLFTVNASRISYIFSSLHLRYFMPLRAIMMKIWFTSWGRRSERGFNLLKGFSKWTYVIIQIKFRNSPLHIYSFFLSEKRLLVGFSFPVLGALLRLWKPHTQYLLYEQHWYFTDSSISLVVLHFILCILMYLVSRK